MCIRDRGKAADQRGGEGRTLSDKIRKYVLPNLPYLFVFWFFSKIGTAYRIAPDTDSVSYTHLDVYKRQIQTTARRGGQLSVETIERICLGLGITLKDFFDSSYL